LISDFGQNGSQLLFEKQKWSYNTPEDNYAKELTGTLWCQELCQ